MIKKPLYVFVAHQQILPQIKHRVTNMMAKLNCLDYVIACGAETTQFVIEDRVLFVQCNDGYEGLPEKVLAVYKFIVTNAQFDQYTHVVKLDSDMVLLRLLNACALQTDYGGHVEFKTGNRLWHIGRCTPTATFNTEPYTGPYVPWCLGGFGYVISREAINAIKNDTSAKDQIYEDLYIALLLHKHKIYPTAVKMTDYVVSAPMLAAT